MRFIKLAILSFIILFLVITAISLFIPSRIRISRATLIHAAKENVMKAVSDAGKWKNWYPGADSMDLLYIGGEVRGIILNRTPRPANWMGLYITEKNDSLVIAKNMGPGAKKEFSNVWKVDPGVAGGAVTVQWYMEFRLRWFPWEKFSSLFFETVYGSHMEHGLTSLKKHLEEN